MLEAMQELVALVKQLPSLSIWILCGVLFYKIVIIGSWFSIIRLLIIKLYDAWAKPRAPREVTSVLKLSAINGRMITCDGSQPQFWAFLDLMMNRRNGIDSEYIHSCDMDWCIEAFHEKALREREKKQEEEAAARQAGTARKVARKPSP